MSQERLTFLERRRRSVWAARSGMLERKEERPHHEREMEILCIRSRRVLSSSIATIHTSVEGACEKAGEGARAVDIIYTAGRARVATALVAKWGLTLSYPRFLGQRRRGRRGRRVCGFGMRVCVHAGEGKPSARWRDSYLPRENLSGQLPPATQGDYDRIARALRREREESFLFLIISRCSAAAYVYTPLQRLFSFWPARIYAFYILPDVASRLIGLNAALLMEPGTFQLCLCCGYKR